MFTRTLLPLLFAMLFAVPAHAQNPASPAKPKTTAKKPKGKTAAQLIAEYTPKVKAVLAARWAAALEPRMSEFSPGNMKVAFKLDAEGKVTDFTVVANTSNEPFAKFCEQFVREATFEAPPADALKGGLLEIPFTFTVL